ARRGAARKSRGRPLPRDGERLQSEPPDRETSPCVREGVCTPPAPQPAPREQCSWVSWWSAGCSLLWAPAAQDSRTPPACSGLSLGVELDQQGAESPVLRCHLLCAFDKECLLRCHLLLEISLSRSTCKGFWSSPESDFSLFFSQTTDLSGRKHSSCLLESAYKCNLFGPLP
ncbi:hypothetical protein Q9233_012561, partial [Columba guinea]